MELIGLECARNTNTFPHTMTNKHTHTQTNFSLQLGNRLNREPGT